MGCGPSSEGQDVWAQNTQKVVNPHLKILTLTLAPTRIMSIFHNFTVFENHIKSLIQHRERSEPQLYFECKKAKIGKFDKVKQCYHTGQFLKSC